MPKFQSLGDGNCLYNTQAIWLVYAYQNKLMEPLFKNKDFVQNFGKLLTFLQTEKEINLPKTLGKNISEKSVKEGFETIIAALSTKKGIDWVKLQKVMGNALRRFVVDAIKHHPSIMKHVKAELTLNINQTIEISTKEDIQLGLRFENMPEIQRQVTTIFNSRLKTIKQRQEAFNKWFFAGKAVGFDRFLNGKNGIAKPGIEAGEFELKILSTLLHYVVKFEGHIINEFKDRDAANNYPKQALLFDVEKVPGHWNALLPNDALTKRIMQAYAPQRAQYIKEKQKTDNIKELQEILATHGSYSTHHHTDLNDFTEIEYCKAHGLTKKQYQNSELPEIAKSSRAKEQIPTSQTKKVKPKSIKPEKSIIKPRTQSNKKRQSTIDNPKKESEKEVEHKHKSMNPNKPARSHQEWVQYALMFAGFVAGTILLSHCFILPLILPLVAPFIVGTYFAAKLGWITSGITTLLSFTLGYALTEKFHSADEASLQKNLKHVKQASANVAPHHEINVEPQLIYLYQNNKVQEHMQEGVLSDNQHLKNYRKKLH